MSVSQAELARKLRRPGLYETFRAATVFEAQAGAAGPLEVDLAVPSPLGDHWCQMASNQFAGVDVVVPYGEHDR